MLFIGVRVRNVFVLANRRRDNSNNKAYFFIGPHENGYRKVWKKDIT
jgi:hypothetical protein